MTITQARAFAVMLQKLADEAEDAELDEIDLNRHFSNLDDQAKGVLEAAIKAAGG